MEIALKTGQVLPSVGSVKMLASTIVVIFSQESIKFGYVVASSAAGWTPAPLEKGADSGRYLDRSAHLEFLIVLQPEDTAFSPVAGLLIAAER